MFKPISFVYICLGLMPLSIAMDHPDREVASVLRQSIEHFANNEGEPLFEPVNKSPRIVKTEIQGKDVIIYGIKQNSQPKIDFIKFRENIAQDMGFNHVKLVQLVGDSSQFSENGTCIAREFLQPYFEGNHILEYGFTGYLTDDRLKLDVNSLLNEYIEAKPEQAYRVLANVVGHSIVALEQWNCKVSSKVSHYVMVYNDHGMKEGFTRFGDDVIASDYIQSAQDGDLMLLLEGGPQSFRQAVNILQRNVPVKAVFNIRPPERRAFFSAAEFFYLVREALVKNSDLLSQAVRDILDTYLKNHEAWDPGKPDADTKENLFYFTVDEFINDKVYKKLVDKVTIIDGAKTASSEPDLQAS